MVKAKEQLLKLFDEGCGSIYQDIQDSFENWNCGQVSLVHLQLQMSACLRWPFKELNHPARISNYSFL